MAISTVEKRFEGIPPKVEKITEELSCELNSVEWQNRAEDLADAQKAAEEMEERKKSVMADLNSDLKTAKLKVSKLARVVASKRELRDVTVEVVYDYEKGIVTKTRTDNKEVISTRNMTTSERQSGLFDEEYTDANDVIEGRHEQEDGNVELDTQEAGAGAPTEEDQVKSETQSEEDSVSKEEE